LHPSKGTFLKVVNEKNKDDEIGIFVNKHGMEGVYRKDMLRKVEKNEEMGGIIDGQYNFTEEDVKSFLSGYELARVVLGCFMIKFYCL
jgi:hypothetical protein